MLADTQATEHKQRTQSPKPLKQKYKKSNTYNTIKKKSKKKLCKTCE